MKKTTLLLSAMLLGGLVATPISADQVKTDTTQNAPKVESGDKQERSFIFDGWNATGGATNNGQETLARGEYSNTTPGIVNGSLTGHTNNHDDVANVSVTITNTQGCTATIQDNGDGTFVLTIVPDEGYTGEIFVGLTAMDTDGSQYTPEVRLSFKDTSIDTSHVHGIMPTQPVIDRPTPDTDEPDTTVPNPDVDNPQPNPDTKVPTKPNDDLTSAKPSKTEEKSTVAEKPVDNKKTEDKNNGRNQVSTTKKQPTKQDTKNQANSRKSSAHRTLPNTGFDKQEAVVVVGVALLIAALLIFFIM